MKRIIFFKFIILVLNYSYSQVELTLEDAVLNRWTKLYPQYLKDLQWNNEKDFFSYQNSDSTLYVMNFNNEVSDVISLSDLNQSLTGEDKLIKFPNIEWISEHSFRFRHHNNYYIFNTERGNKAMPLFDVKTNAEHIEFDSQNKKYTYTINNNLHVCLGLDNHIQITESNNEDIVYGSPVHRYEFGIYKGTFWSNSGDMLAFYRKDESMVTDYPLLDINSRVGEVEIIKYPMAGMQSHHVSVGIYNFHTEEIIYLETGKPKEQYLTNIAWGPTDQYIYVAVLNRDQNHLKMNQYSALDGSFVKTLFEEKSDTYIQPLNPMEFISSDNFLWRSEREGFDNFYIYNTSGKFIKKLLNRPHVVKDYYGYSDDHIYFSTYSKDGLGVDLWNVSVNKRYKKKIVSDGSFHAFQVSPTKSFFIDKLSNLETPLITRIINHKGNLITTLLESKNPLEKYNIGVTDLIKIKTDDNITLNARMIKPHDFNENQKYPVLIYVYNGPGVQLIRNNWLASSPLWMYHLANQNYIVFTIDGRGSDNRGRDFEQVIFRELGNVEMLDQIKGYDYLVDLDFIDSNRIAVHGWSYGGFMTTNLLLNYPHLFTCGVAGGPVTNWEYYEIMYTERYMDHPNQNQEGYLNTNLIHKVHLLEDPLLMIHGLVDDIVLPQHSLDYIKHSVDQNIQIDYFIYPGHAHNVRGKDRLHLIQKIINYIRDNNQ